MQIIKSGRNEKNMTGEKNQWKRAEFLFCFVVIWSAALFQGYALYQEWKGEQDIIESMNIIEAADITVRKTEDRIELKGNRAGRMTMEEKAEMTDRLFHSLDAEIVEAVCEEELYTVYGYTPILNNVSVCYGENEINLNLAFFYYEEEDVTMIYLAVPFIQEDY